MTEGETDIPASETINDNSEALPERNMPESGNFSTLPFTPLDLEGLPRQPDAPRVSDPEMMAILQRIQEAQDSAPKAPIPEQSSPSTTNSERQSIKEKPDRLDKWIKILKPLAIPILAFLALFNVANDLNKSASQSR